MTNAKKLNTEQINQFKKYFDPKNGLAFTGQIKIGAKFITQWSDLFPKRLSSKSNNHEVFSDQTARNLLKQKPIRLKNYGKIIELLEDVKRQIGGQNYVMANNPKPLSINIQGAFTEELHQIKKEASYLRYGCLNYGNANRDETFIQKAQVFYDKSKMYGEYKGLDVAIQNFAKTIMWRLEEDSYIASKLSKNDTRSPLERRNEFEEEIKILNKEFDGLIKVINQFLEKQIS